MSEVTPDTKSCLNFINYKIISMNFQVNNVFEEKPVKIDFSIDKKIEINDDKAEVTLNLSIFRNSKKNNYPFELDMIVTGLFRIQNFNIETQMKLIEVNAVAILFPYLRSLVTTITANANVPPLILPPINVVNLLSKK